MTRHTHAPIAHVGIETRTDVTHTMISKTAISSLRYFDYIHHWHYLTRNTSPRPLNGRLAQHAIFSMLQSTTTINKVYQKAMKRRVEKTREFGIVPLHPCIATEFGKLTPQKRPTMAPRLFCVKRVENRWAKDNGDHERSISPAYPQLHLAPTCCPALKL